MRAASMRVYKKPPILLASRMTGKKIADDRLLLHFGMQREYRFGAVWGKGIAQTIMSFDGLFNKSR